MVFQFKYIQLFVIGGYTLNLFHALTKYDAIRSFERIFIENDNIFVTKFLCIPIKYIYDRITQLINYH